MKLNLGCGFNKLEGHVNVDKEAACHPDQVMDMEKLPWPFQDDTFTDVMAYHSLEHVGQTPEVWIGILKELWRVCKPGALVRIAVPHPRHENFLHDPTHVRAITPIGIAMFDQVRNVNDLKAGGQESKLGLYSGIDWELLEVHHDLDEPWRSAQARGQVTNEQLNEELRTRNNVCYQIRMVLRIVKPARGAGLLGG